METPWEVAFATADEDARPAAKLRPSKWFRVTRTEASRLLRRRELPPVTVVKVAEEADPDSVKAIARSLARKSPTSSGAKFVIFALEGDPRKLPAWDVELFRPFANPERVEIARMRDLDERMEALVPKLRAIGEDPPGATGHEAEEARPSPLDRVEEVIAATRDLREPSGRLSARRVAQAFGVPMSRVAQWLGRSRQAVAKTPGAESLQEPLGYFERIARLRAALENRSDFQRWLRLPNPEIGGARPLDLIDEGRWQEVADLVDDMLTGSPT